jgi:hypothetical protein
VRAVARAKNETGSRGARNNGQAAEQGIAPQAKARANRVAALQSATCTSLVTGDLVRNDAKHRCESENNLPATALMAGPWRTHGIETRLLFVAQ